MEPRPDQAGASFALVVLVAILVIALVAFAAIWLVSQAEGGGGEEEPDITPLPLTPPLNSSAFGTAYLLGAWPLPQGGSFA